MRSGHYNRGKADARRRASGKLRLCSVCCRAHCCGALGRGFCRWRTVRTQVFAAQLAGPVRPTVPVKGCGTTLAAPGRTRHPFLRPCQSAYFKMHMQKRAFARPVFLRVALFFGIVERKWARLPDREKLTDFAPSNRAPRAEKCRRGKNRTCVFRLFVLKRGLVKRVFGKPRLPGDELDRVFFR